MGVVAFPFKPGSPLAQVNTFKAMLADTKDLLQQLSYKDSNSSLAAQAQIEAINEILAT